MLPVRLALSEFQLSMLSLRKDALGLALSSGDIVNGHDSSTVHLLHDTRRIEKRYMKGSEVR